MAITRARARQSRGNDAGSSAAPANVEQTTIKQEMPAPHRRHFKANCPRRTRSHIITLGKDISIHMAKKKDQVKTERKEKISRLDWTFVYVGNIEPSVDEPRLRELFASCGMITRIQFRCSRGQAITIGMAIAPSVRTLRDRQYATVEFTNPVSVRKALKLNNTVLEGSRLVVSVSPADLPEVDEIVRAHMSKLAQRQPQATSLAPRGSSSLSKHTKTGVQLQRTELSIEGPTFTKAWIDRHRIFGISFAKSVV